MHAQGAEHPFQAAFRTRDLAAWSSHFASDITLQSPLLTNPFKGYEAAAELYEVLFSALEDVEFAFFANEGNVDAFHWRGRAGGRQIEGVDLITWTDERKISEIRVMIRTLPS